MLIELTLWVLETSKGRAVSICAVFNIGSGWISLDSMQSNIYAYETRWGEKQTAGTDREREVASPCVRNFNYHLNCSLCTAPSQPQSMCSFHSHGNPEKQVLWVSYKDKFKKMNLRLCNFRQVTQHCVHGDIEFSPVSLQGGHELLIHFFHRGFFICDSSLESLTLL